MPKVGSREGGRVRAGVQKEVGDEFEEVGGASAPPTSQLGDP